MKLAITNSLVLNGGEAATVRATARMLRETLGPDVEIVVFDQHGDVAAKYYPDQRFHKLFYYLATRGGRVPIVGKGIAELSRRRFLLAAGLWGRGRRGLARMLLLPRERRALQDYASADVIISSGGTYLTPNYDLRPRLFDYEVARRVGRRLAFFPQSIGPFQPGPAMEPLRSVLDSAALVLVRDEASLRNLREIGVRNQNAFVSADAAFALVDPPPARADREGGRPRVAVSVRYWGFFKNGGMDAYRDAMVRAVTHLVRRHDADVTFLSSCQGIPEYWADDAVVADGIVERLDAGVRESVRVDRVFRGPEAMVRDLAAYDFVVATRFHMAVFAMLAGAPPLSMAYEFKTGELYRDIGLDGWVVDVERPADVCDAIDRCLPARAEARRVIARGVAAQRAEFLKAGRLLKDVLMAGAS